MTQSQDLIGATEAAPILGEDARTVQRKAKAGEYPAAKLPGLRGAYIFNRADIERIAAERKADAA